MFEPTAGPLQIDINSLFGRYIYRQLCWERWNIHCVRPLGPAYWEAPETLRPKWVFTSGETEVRGMWVFSPGETPDARKVGVSPGRDCGSAEDGCSPVEMIVCIIGL